MSYQLSNYIHNRNLSLIHIYSGVLLTNVKDTKGAIGYVALSYLTGDAGVETVAIDGVEPTLENTYSGEYPVCLLYTSRCPEYQKTSSELEEMKFLPDMEDVSTTRHCSSILTAKAGTTEPLVRTSSMQI